MSRITIELISAMFYSAIFGLRRGHDVMRNVVYTIDRMMDSKKDR